ncbi:hypothetical protein ACJRO7_006250 [Eucalyptus globulus]|uniref:Wall-associated receptor kinase galacturonan-binding domain-containing protein n=1 Tax=Eucalyptus globulus TaxID=34317 RepID=A0ABD3IIQ8_EUCGL
MINALSSMNIHSTLLLVLLLLQAMAGNVGLANPQCVTSSCGDIRNISHPFRLKSDPKGCGDPKKELRCEGNRTILYFHDGQFYVQSIDYSNHQIRLVDDRLQKDNCLSLPHHSWPLYDFKDWSDPNNAHYSYDHGTLLIVNNSKSVGDPLYIARRPCIEGSDSSNTSSDWNLYALLNPPTSDVRDFCTISWRTWVSPNFGPFEHVNISSYNYKQIHKIMTDGFVLHYTSWKTSFFCWLTFVNFYYGDVCGKYFGYTGGKHRLAMKFYNNIA